MFGDDTHKKIVSTPGVRFTNRGKTLTSSKTYNSRAIIAELGEPQPSLSKNNVSNFQNSYSYIHKLLIALLLKQTFFYETLAVTYCAANV